MGACRVLWYGRLFDVVEETLQSSQPAFYTREPAEPGPRRRTTEGGVKYTLPRPTYCAYILYILCLCTQRCLQTQAIGLCELKPLRPAPCCSGPQSGKPLGLVDQLNGTFILSYPDHTDHTIGAWLYCHVYRL